MHKTTRATMIIAVLVTASSTAQANNLWGGVGELTFETELELGIEDEDTLSTVAPSLKFSSYSGVYVGLELSTTYETENDFAYTAYVGYAAEIGDISYDLYYGQDRLNETGRKSEKVHLTVEYPAFGDVSMAIALTTDLEGSQSVEQIFFYNLSPYQISGAYEHANNGSNSWELGLSRSVTDELSLDVRYLDSEDEGPRFALKANYQISIFGD